MVVKVTVAGDWDVRVRPMWRWMGADMMDSIVTVVPRLDMT